MNGSGVPWAGNGDTGSRNRLRGVHRCDVVIIGAGPIGLSTAVELLERDPNSRIIVVEADHVAAGASGRGTGLLSARLGPALTTLRKRYGDVVARIAHIWSLTAVRHVLDLVERHEISCELTRGSQLVVASDAGSTEQQRREAEAARVLELPISFVERESLPAVAAGYTSGLRYATTATLDPAALTEQLARIGEQRGLTIFERSPVRGIRRGLLNTVSTDDGEIVADRVVVAVNAFGATLGEPAGVVGLRVQAGVTEKLSHDALAALDGLATEPLIEHGELSPYFRLTADGRVVVGGGAIRRGPFGSIAPAPGSLRAVVRNLSPALADVEIESTWAGPIGVTRDGLPFVGQDPDDPGLYYAGGCNGHGLAVSIYNGAYLARWIVNGDKDDLSYELPWVRSKGPWMPSGFLVDRVLDRYLAHLMAESDRFGGPSHVRGAQRTGQSAHA